MGAEQEERPSSRSGDVVEGMALAFAFIIRVALGRIVVEATSSICAIYIIMRSAPTVNDESGLIISFNEQLLDQRPENLESDCLSGGEKIYGDGEEEDDVASLRRRQR